MMPEIRTGNPEIADAGDSPPRGFRSAAVPAAVVGASRPPQAEGKMPSGHPARRRRYRFRDVLLRSGPVTHHVVFVDRMIVLKGRRSGSPGNQFVE